MLTGALTSLRVCRAVVVAMPVSAMPSTHELLGAADQ